LGSFSTSSCSFGRITTCCVIVDERYPSQASLSNHAIVENIPIVTALVDGYNNDVDVNEYLAHLGTELDEKTF
jgi:hypothetical protein